MLKGERITLLIIPEAGGKTFELKLPRLLIMVAITASIAMLALLGLGLKSYLDAHSLGQRVARLEREKALLEEEVEQIEQLEQVLMRLQRSNQQLRAILGESVGGNFERKRADGGGRESYIAASERLRWGHVQSFPGLWPVEGVVVRPFTEIFPATVIATPPESLIRASGAGQVVRAGFDEDLGYLVVLDHGGRLSSQYGYNDRLLVEAGDYVEKGQPLALSGHTGGASLPSLYFAIRENGRPRNPADYRLWL
jgi:murein DD-endopeptidase MepM/ murein hydrolase activator NlpD